MNVFFNTSSIAAAASISNNFKPLQNSNNFYSKKNVEGSLTF